MKDSVQDDPQQLARVEALRSLCQGLPLLHWPSKVEVPKDTLDLFNVEDTEDFRRLVRKALDLMIDGPYKNAIESALGAWSFADTLTQRRNAFLEGRNITYRTLIRHEQEGASRLAHLMVNISGEESVETTRESIDSLTARIRDLEVVVRGLTELSSALITQVAEGTLHSDALENALTRGKQDDELAAKLYRNAQISVVVEAEIFEDHMREQAEGLSLPDDAD